MGKSTDKNKEIFRFATTGLVVVGMDMGIYYLLINVLPNSIAKGISFTCGGVVAYLLNKYWTFQQEKKSSKEVVRFIVANLFALGLNIVSNETILKINDDAVFLAVSVATVLTGLFSFLIFKFWVFKAKV